MISPSKTWAALGVGLASLAGAIAPVAAALAGIPSPISVVFGPVLGPKISAACGIISAVAMVLAAKGRSIDPGVDAGVRKP